MLINIQNVTNVYTFNCELCLFPRWLPAQLVHWCKWGGKRSCLVFDWWAAIDAAVSARWGGGCWASVCHSPPHNQHQPADFAGVFWRQWPGVVCMPVDSPLGHIPGSWWEGYPAMSVMTLMVMMMICLPAQADSQVLFALGLCPPARLRTGTLYPYLAVDVPNLIGFYHEHFLWATVWHLPHSKVWQQSALTGCPFGAQAGEST